MSRNVTWANIGGNRSVFDAVIQYFRDDDWNFDQLEGKTILSMRFRGENGSWQFIVRVKEDKQQVLFYSTVDVDVPSDKRQAIAEYLTRANYGLKLGNFEMDFSDGEIRFKTSIDVEGGQLTPLMIKNLVYSNVLVTDRYLPGIMSIMYGEISPAEAIANVES